MKLLNKFLLIKYKHYFNYNNINISLQQNVKYLKIVILYSYAIIFIQLNIAVT